MKRTCGDCGNRFETELTEGPCGLRDCPSAGGGTGKPPKTTARGRPLDDRKVRTRARKPASGYVQQRSTGFDLVDAVTDALGCLPLVLALVTLAALLGGGIVWGAVELVAVLAPW